MNRPLTVVFFTASSSPQGTYFRTHNLAAALQAKGNQVTVMAVNTEGSTLQNEVRDGVDYRFVSPAPGQRWLGLWAHPINVLKQTLASPPSADIYHIFQPFPTTCAPGLWHRKKAQAMIYDWDDYWAPELKRVGAMGNFMQITSRSIAALEASMPSRVDATTACSGFLRDLAASRGSQATQVIHNGYWPDQPTLPKREARAALGLDKDAYYYGFMGRTTGEILWCLDPLQLSKSFPVPVRLALCGMPKEALPPIDGEIANRLDYLGMLTPDQARVFSQGIDCGLLPLEDSQFNRSRFPIKFAEYLAGGSEVIASNVGEVSILGRQIPAVHIAPASRESWASTVNTHLQSLAANGPPRSPLLNFSLSWPSIAETLVDFYQDTLARVSRRHCTISPG